MKGMLDVVLDMTPVAHSMGGVGRYLRRLTGDLRRIAPAAGIRFRTFDIPAARKAEDRFDLDRQWLRKLVIPDDKELLQLYKRSISILMRSTQTRRF